MKQDEIIQLHSYLVEIKKYVEQNYEDADFEDYNSIEVSPIRNDMPKSEHMKAIFLLGEEIAEHFSDDEFSDIGRLGQRMREHKEEVEA